MGAFLLETRGRSTRGTASPRWHKLISFFGQPLLSGISQQLPNLLGCGG
jgi:hypothetical protein